MLAFSALFYAYNFMKALVCLLLNATLDEAVDRGSWGRVFVVFFLFCCWLNNNVIPFFNNA